MKPKHLLLITLFLSGLDTGQAEVKLAALFTDHMVLQRDIAVPVWGSADAGDEISVEFAGQKKSATADTTGKWMLKLDPLPASTEPRELTGAGSEHR